MPSLSAAGARQHQLSNETLQRIDLTGDRAGPEVIERHRLQTPEFVRGIYFPFVGSHSVGNCALSASILGRSLYTMYGCVMWLYR